MGVFEDLQKGAKDIADSLIDTGRDAQDAVDKAARNTVALAGSGVSAGGLIFGPLADMFGKDPQEFITNLAIKTRSRSRELLVRVATRTGKLNYEFQTLQGRRKITARPASNASANQIALTLALCAMDSPATMNEEAGRMAAGLAVKPRGLSGFTVFPMSLPNGAARGLEGSAQERGLFVIDDALIASVMAIAIPIIIGIALKVLPGLIAAAGGAVTKIVDDLTGKTASTEADAAAAAAARAAAEQRSTMTTVAIVAVVVLLGGGAIFMATRKKS